MSKLYRASLAEPDVVRHQHRGLARPVPIGDGRDVQRLGHVAGGSDDCREGLLPPRRRELLWTSLPRSSATRRRRTRATCAAAPWSPASAISGGNGAGTGSTDEFVELYTWRGDDCDGESRPPPPKHPRCIVAA